MKKLIVSLIAAIALAVSVGAATAQACTPGQTVHVTGDWYATCYWEAFLGINTWYFWQWSGGCGGTSTECQ